MSKRRGRRARLFDELVQVLMDEMEPLLLAHGTPEQRRVFTWAVRTLRSQNRYRKDGYSKPAHDTICEENGRLDEESVPKRGRPKEILRRNPELENASKDPVRYIRDHLREIYEK